MTSRQLDRRDDLLLFAAVLGLAYVAVLAEVMRSPVPDEPPVSEGIAGSIVLFLLVAVPFSWLLRLVLARVLVAVGRPEPRWGFAEILLFFGINLLLMFGLGVIGAIASRSLGLSESNELLVLLLSQIAAEILGIYFIVVALFLAYRQGPRALGLTWARSPRLVAGSALAWFLFSPIFAIAALSVELIRSYFGQGPDPQELIRVVQGMGEEGVHGPLLVAVVVAAVFMAPVFEEILFRGFLYGYLRRRMRPFPAMILCAGAFTVVHGQASVAPPIFLLGFFLTYVYERTGSLLTSITVHTMHNATIMSYIVFAVLAGSA